MKILVISVVTPYPIDAGGNAGTFKLIDHARKNNDITFISLPASLSQIQGLKEVWPNVAIHTKVAKDAPVSLSSQLKNSIKKVVNNNIQTSSPKLLLHKTNLMDGFYEGFVKEVQTLCNENKYDLIQVEYIELAPIVHFLPKDVPNVFVHHELRYRRMEYEYGLMKHQSLNDAWKIHNTKTLEVGLMNSYDHVITVSENDKQHLVTNGVSEAKITSSPSPVELVDRNINLDFKFQNKLIYLGPESHYPNEDGVRWFLEHCWPEISATYPSLVFQIVGKWTKETQASMPQHKNVSFLGFVDNLGDVFEGAALIVPLRIGGGMRMKILEAISWNTPIITSTIGAEGLPMKHLENCLIADDSQGYLSAIAKLYKTHKLAKDMTIKAKEILKNTYSIERCGDIRAQVYQKITG